MTRKPWPLPKPCLHKQIRETKNDKRVVLHELIDVVTMKWLLQMGSNETVRPIDRILAVNDCITAIINKEIFA